MGSSLSKHLVNNNNLEVIRSSREDTNLFDYKSTKKLISESSPDIIVNAAAKVGGIYANNTKRTEFLLENLKININILESCIDQPSIKIINLGSSCIYPLYAKNPINEDEYMNGALEPTNSPYAMAKLTSIELGRSLKIQYGHKIVNLMPTNLYGPNDNFSKENSHVIPGLISRMHDAKINNKEVFKIWGTGKPLREFLFVNDLSDAINFIITNDIENDLINIGSGEEISINELAIKISKTLNFSGELIFDDSKPDGNPRKLLDSTLINSLGWKSKTSLDEGLNQTYEWFINNFDNIKKD